MTPERAIIPKTKDFAFSLFSLLQNLEVQNKVRIFAADTEKSYGE